MENDRADRLAWKETITSGLCLGSFGVLRNLKITCWQKAKDITRSISWRTEAQKKKALGDILWKDEKEPSSIRRTLELFQRQHEGNLWNTKWNRVSYGFYRAHRYHFQLKWPENTIHCGNLMLNDGVPNLECTLLVQNPEIKPLRLTANWFQC